MAGEHVFFVSLTFWCPPDAPGDHKGKKRCRRGVGAPDGGRLLPQRLRGQLVEAAGRLEGRQVDRGTQQSELLAILEHHLPRFLVQT